MKTGFFVIGIALLLGACDRIYGVASQATLDGPVDTSCVSAALASIREAGHVTYMRDESNSVEFLPKQRKVRTIMHVWLYGEAQNSVLQINQTTDGWDFTNTQSRIGEAVPQTEIDRFIPVMRKVNRALQDQCGLPVANLQAEPIS